MEVSYDNNAINGGIDLTSEIKKEKYLNVPYEKQINNYYSAPASITILLNSIEIETYNQQQISDKLEINKNNKNFSNNIENILNEIVKGSKYKFKWENHKNVNNLNSIINNVTTAIEYGNPIIINTEENLGDIFLRGHNSGLSFDNYGIIYAYLNYGNDFMYLDPGYDRFSGFVKSQKTKVKDLDYAMEGRGYVW